jgi:uncharacterized membrane protein HdeD (DUF308 family)
MFRFRQFKEAPMSVDPDKRISDPVSGPDAPGSPDATRSAVPRPIARRLKRNWFLIAALGAFLVAGGLAAIAMPIAAGVAVSMIVGAVLLVGGAMQVWDAFTAEGWRARALHAVSGVLYVIGGLLLLTQPLAGVITLSLLIVAILIADGAVRIGIGLTMRPERGWGWLTASGAVSLLLGTALVLFALPAAGLTTLGLVTGVSLILEGAAFIYVGFANRPESDRAATPDATPHARAPEARNPEARAQNG